MTAPSFTRLSAPLVRGRHLVRIGRTLAQAWKPGPEKEAYEKTPNSARRWRAEGIHRARQGEHPSRRGRLQSLARMPRAGRSMPLWVARQGLSSGRLFVYPRLGKSPL